jgi:hypothetical protein
MHIHACIDCIHFIPHRHNDASLARCGHEFEINFVTGERDYKFCEIVRKHGACTPYAVYFEQRQDPREQERDDQDGEPF